MENKELEKPAPVELEDETLENVSGGEVLQFVININGPALSCRNYVCSYCGYTKTDPQERNHWCQTKLIHHYCSNCQYCSDPCKYYET